VDVIEHSPGDLPEGFTYAHTAGRCIVPIVVASDLWPALEIGWDPIASASMSVNASWPEILGTAAAIAAIADGALVLRRSPPEHQHPRAHSWT
jgi:hypothetical protein